MILIVGGAGYVGSHTNKHLTKKGFQTVVFDSLIRGHRDFLKWGSFVHGDLWDIDNLRICFDKYPIDAVLHFSSFAYVGESCHEPAKYYENNVANTLNLLKVMREQHVRHLVFSSSCAVYGEPQTIPITEEHPQKPISPYGRSKVMVEQILKDYDFAYGIKHVNLRYFNAAGADEQMDIGERHLPETHLIPLAIFAALGIKKSLEIFGTDYATVDGTCVRDYIHVTDLAEAHSQALDYVRRSNRSDSFNLGNNKGYSVRDIVNTVKKLSGKSFEIIEAARREGDPPSLISSNRKAAEILGWLPKHSDIETIIESALRWHMKDVAVA